MTMLSINHTVNVWTLFTARSFLLANRLFFISDIAYQIVIKFVTEYSRAKKSNNLEIGPHRSLSGKNFTSFLAFYRFKMCTC